MKVSESWLNEWVDTAVQGQQLADQLTMAGLEVDSHNPVAGVFSNVVVAKVLNTIPHPQANKLTLCEVDAGKETHFKIVCGAANVRQGLYVALALPGAHLPGDVHIKETMLRGELSQGMLCSNAELGIEEQSEGIMELPENAPIGMDLREFLSLNDNVLEIDLTPNRADCFSILGVAREVAALNHRPLKKISAAQNQPTIDRNKNIHLSEPQACPQYCGRIISGINSTATTPLWMRERLRRSGIRSLHPVVDVTNYVMVELGQPMHAFNLDALDGDITIRFSAEGETLHLLDGQEVNLFKNTLLIADETKPLAIAGVMGGEESSVQEETQNIFLESAFFHPKHIAGVARKYGLTTDSSQRFERGVDPALQLIALERATELLAEITGGEIGPITQISNKEYLPEKKSIQFDPLKVKQLTGVDIPANQMITLLKNLGLDVNSEENKWVVTVPTHRFDVHLEVDLVEEIIRLYGYDHIKPQPMVTTVKAGSINTVDSLMNKLGDFFKGRGYLETISYSFVDPELQNEIYPHNKALELLNPISQELSQMRLGLWPGLIASMIYNVHRQQTSLKLFETGVVFKTNDNEMSEEAHIAGLIMGEYGALNWSESTRKMDFYDLKGDVEALFKVLNIKQYEFIAAENSALHPGKTAKVMINGNEAGWIGVIHPRLGDALGINNEVMLFDFKTDSLLASPTIRYQSISKYPLIRRDLSFIVDKHINVAQIEKSIREACTNDWLQDIKLFDVYTGANIPSEKKSIALALILQSENRTLEDKEINPLISAIIKKLEEKFAILLRD